MCTTLVTQCCTVWILDSTLQRLCAVCAATARLLYILWQHHHSPVLIWLGAIPMIYDKTPSTSLNFGWYLTVLWMTLVHDSKFKYARNPVLRTTLVHCSVVLLSDVYSHSWMHTVWVKKIPPPWFFSIFSKTVGNFLVQTLHTCYTFLSTLDYKILSNYLQLWRSYAILSTTTFICSKCPPLVETHAGWLHLIWHNFVVVWDNWIKFCSLV